MIEVITGELDRIQLVCVAKMLAKQHSIPFDGVLFAAVVSHYHRL